MFDMDVVRQLVSPLLIAAVILVIVWTVLKLLAPKAPSKFDWAEADKMRIKAQAGQTHCTDCGKALITKSAQDGFTRLGEPVWKSFRLCPDSAGRVANCGHKVITSPSVRHVDHLPSDTTVKCGACIDQMVRDEVIDESAAAPLYAAIGASVKVEDDEDLGNFFRRMGSAWPAGYIPPSLTPPTYGSVSITPGTYPTITPPVRPKRRPTPPPSSTSAT